MLGKVIAGTPIDAIENITEYIRITDPSAADGSYYALHVTGNSMEPEMKEGDLVIVHQQEYFDSGDICIVLVNGNEATIKKCKRILMVLLSLASMLWFTRPTFILLRKLKLCLFELLERLSRCAETIDFSLSNALME